THNLIARLPGKNPDAGAVLVVAHWDHFGHCGDSIDTSQICNGAVDNASGLAFVTELARILASGQRMDRDVYFLATTAEEWGLLGARAFAQEPALPLTDIVAAFNVDSIAVAPRGTSLSILGRGLTNLDHDIESVARKMGRHVNGAGPEVQYLRRQDVWALLQRDVPTVAVSSAFSDPATLKDFIEHRYHKPADKMEAVELGGAAQDLLLHVALIRHFADAGSWAGNISTE
ncbi:MAG: M28 family peptidase, partial [Sphingomonadaceae bacterium]